MYNVNHSHDAVTACLAQRGAIVVDGRDIGVYDAKWLRRQVALVAQEPVLYARSIRRNIVYGLEPEDGCTTPSQVCPCHSPHKGR
jgi:ABC-type phosphate transport system ATPase subunit